MAKNESVVIGVRVSKEFKAELAEIAKEQNRNLSNTVETILKDYVKQQKEEQQKSNWQCLKLS